MNLQTCTQTRGVTSATKKILEDALALPEREREASVEALSDSLEPETVELRGKYTDDADALTALEQIAREPEMHRRHSDYHAYEFFVVRR